MPKLRDYLAVNAPEVPEWFKTDFFNFDLKPPVPPEHPTTFQSEELRKEYLAWTKDPEWDLPTSLCEIENEWKQYWRDKTRYKNLKIQAQKTYRLVCWQYFYADQMIAIRNSEMPKILWFKHPLFALLFMLFLAIGCLFTYFWENSHAFL